MIKCISSYVGYRNDECTIACAIVNRDSNEKQVFKAGDNNAIDVLTPALHILKERCQCWASNVGPHVDTDGL